MPTAADMIKNPMWDEVLPHLVPSLVGDGPELEVDWMDVGRMVNFMTHRDLPVIDRVDVIWRHAWPVTSPKTIAFVAEHLGPAAIDPMAGTGYWGYLLDQVGVDIVSSDANPPDVSFNHYHRYTTWTSVAQQDGATAVTAADPHRSLLLSWPPDGHDVLAAFRGNRVVFIGELGGNSGSVELVMLLAT